METYAILRSALEVSSIEDQRNAKHKTVVVNVSQ